MEQLRFPTILFDISSAFFNGAILRRGRKELQESVRQVIVIVADYSVTMAMPIRMKSVIEMLYIFTPNKAVYNVQ